MNAIEFDHVGKQYRLGLVSTGTFSHDLNRWWTMNVRHKEDPNLKIGETNDRSKKGDSNYVWALKDINFNVEQGDVVGIIGKNGAGKSTLLKLLSRVTTPTVGEIRARGRIASLLEVGTGFHPEMTGRENIFMNGAIMGMTKQEIGKKLDEIIDFSGCERYIDTPVKRYSSGMTVRLGFAIAAHLEPEILVVDEVLAVGDAEFQKKAIGKMQDVSKGQGRTVLFVSHNMDSMLKLCKKGVILENGMVKYQSDIASTVAEYLNNDISDSSYSCDENNTASPVYLSSFKFVGTDNQKRGLFSLNDKISIDLNIKKKSGFVLEQNMVMSILINTLGGMRVATKEIPLSNFDREKEYHLEYPANVLMPNKYVFKIVIHIPNVRVYDQHEVAIFTLYDTNSDFNKYGGNNHGVICYEPQIQSL